MGVEVKINLDNSPEYEDMIKFGIMRGLEAAGGNCEGYAKDECPVDTGRLRDSIAHQLEGYDSVVIGTNVEYGIYVHEGTHRMAGRPFLRNAAQNHAQEYADLIRQSLEA